MKREREARARNTNVKKAIPPYNVESPPFPPYNVEGRARSPPPRPASSRKTPKYQNGVNPEAANLSLNRPIYIISANGIQIIYFESRGLGLKPRGQMTPTSNRGCLQASIEKPRNSFFVGNPTRAGRPAGPAGRPCKDFFFAGPAGLPV